MSPVVTVLTAVHNGARHLRETIDSIRRQTVEDWEYVIVDDASEDESPVIAAEAMEADPRIRLVRRPERGGPYAAANEGLAHAEGRFIVRIDGDDVAMPNRIERQLSYLDRTGLRACASFFRKFTDAGELMAETPRQGTGVRSLKYRLCLGYGLVHSTACLERTALIEIGGYRELPMSQDLRMWCELARRDWLGIVPEVLVHLRRPGSLTSASTEDQERLAVDIVKEHLDALSRRAWSDEEVRALRPVWSGIPVRSRIAALGRWRNLWRDDEGLDRSDRRELARLGRRVRWEMTRSAILREGLSISTLRGIAGKSALGADSR